MTKISYKEKRKELSKNERHVINGFSSLYLYACKDKDGYIEKTHIDALIRRAFKVGFTMAINSDLIDHLG